MDTPSACRAKNDRHYRVSSHSRHTLALAKMARLAASAPPGITYEVLISNDATHAPYEVWITDIRPERS